MPKTYKIGFRNMRKDARRHLLTSFKAENDVEAAKKMFEILKDKFDEKYEYRLYTGDWINISMCTGNCMECADFGCSNRGKKVET